MKKQLNLVRNSIKNFNYQIDLKNHLDYSIESDLVSLVSKN